MTDINAYDESGIPASTNAGRFQYTGQQWIAELGMYHYRARIYSPTFGRFLQTDPIEYAGGMNLYAYVLNDPINLIDPLGLAYEDPDIVVSRRRWQDLIRYIAALNSIELRNLLGRLSAVLNAPEPEIVVKGTRPQRPPQPPRRSIFLIPSILLTSISSSERDYCGAGGSAWIPDRVGPGDLRAACLSHDQCYATPGASKAACDLGLGRDVFGACVAGGGRVEFCAALANSYFWGVTIGGHGPFRDAQRNARRGR